MLYKESKEYLLDKLKAAGLKSKPYTTQKALEKSQESHIGAVLFESETLLRNGSKTRYRDQEGAQKKRRKVFDRALAFTVIIGDYRKWGIDEQTDFSNLRPEDYPVLSDLYDIIEEAYQNYEHEENLKLYPPEMLRDLLLGLHSMCKGADARFFNGPTNISSARFLVFCMKGLDNVAQNLRDALLFTILSYLSDQLLTAGNTVAAIDELYLWLSNPTAVTYIRNCLKRVRKKESSLILASQNLEDFDQPGVRELTRPLFAIPTHQFLFNPGSVDGRFYMDNLQLEPFEYELVCQVRQGNCLYKCGKERYLLRVIAPKHKAELFGTAGGR